MLEAEDLVARTEEGDAPKGFSKLSRSKDPRNALLFSCMSLFAGGALPWAEGGVAAAFCWVTTISAPCFIFVWSIVLVSYLVYRERRPQLHAACKSKRPGGTFMPYVVLVFFGFIFWALTAQGDTLGTLLLTPIWFVVLGIGFVILRSTPSCGPCIRPRFPRSA